MPCGLRPGLPRPEPTPRKPTGPGRDGAIVHSLHYAEHQSPSGAVWTRSPPARFNASILGATTANHKTGVALALAGTGGVGPLPEAAE